MARSMALLAVVANVPHSNVPHSDDWEVLVHLAALGATLDANEHACGIRSSLPTASDARFNAVDFGHYVLTEARTREWETACHLRQPPCGQLTRLSKISETAGRVAARAQGGLSGLPFSGRAPDDRQNNPALRRWATSFTIGNASRRFSCVRTWVEQKLRRHLMRAGNHPRFGWQRGVGGGAPNRWHCMVTIARGISGPL